MRALVFDLALWKYLGAKAVGPRARRLFYGPGTCFALREVPAPRRPGDDWVLLKPTLAGFCGSDLAAIFFKMSPAMSAVSLGAGDQAVFGHETLAEVVEVGPGARDRVREGDRVVVDPVLGCAQRGVPACPRCGEGRYAVCERFGSKSPKGIMLGACVEYPGGFGECMVAHRDQLFVVPDRVPDTSAVLTEPLAVGVRAVMQHPPRGKERVLVIGGGMIAFAVLWALRELYPEVDVTLFTVERYQLDLAERMGAQRAWSPAGGSILEQTSKLTGSRVLEPVIGRGFLQGGFDRVWDCVGSAQSLDDSMRVARAGGTVVMVGAAGIMPKIDLTFSWQKELKIEGTVFYGFETYKGSYQRTFAVTLDLLRTTDRPIGSLVTHAFPLERYADAIEANLDRHVHRSVKTVFKI